MDHKKPDWAWALVAAPLLFILHVGIFAYRFERVENILMGVIFLPAGLIAAVSLIYCLRASHSVQQKRNTWIGYVMGIPFAFVGSFILPVYLPLWIGTTLGGACPWALMTWIAYCLPLRSS